MGTVTTLTTFGIDYAPKIELENGQIYFYCGKDLTKFCCYVPLFIQTMQEMGETQGTIDLFLATWFANVDEQRKLYYDGLVDARNNGQQSEYITTVKTAIGM
jgi:hypothetical protein